MTAAPTPTHRALTIGVRRPRAVLAVTVFLVVAAALLMTRLHADTSVGSLLGNSSPTVRSLNRVLNHFGPAEDLVVLAEIPEGSGPAGPGDRAAALRDFAAHLQARLATPEHASLVRHVQFAPAPEFVSYVAEKVVPAGAYFLDDAGMQALRERLTLDSMRAQFRQNETMLSAPGPAGGALAKGLIRDPLRLRDFLSARLTAAADTMRTYPDGPEFISEDARAILIRVAGTSPPSNLDFAARLTDEVSRAASDISPGFIRVSLAGSYAIAAESASAIRRDMISNTVWSTFGMGLLFLLMYRNPLAFPFAMLPVGVGLVIAFGIHALFETGLTPLTAVIGSVLAGLGIDYGVHLFSHAESERASGSTIAGACDRSLRSLAWPLVMACATSIAGFVALLGSGVGALRDFALLGCLGLALVLIASITALPAFLCILPAPLARASFAGPRCSFAPLVDWTSRHARACTAAVTAAAGLGLLTLALTPGPVLRFEDDLRAMHPRPNAALDAQDRVSSIFGISAGSFLIHLTAPDDTELLVRAHRVGDALSSPAARPIGIAATLGPHLLLPDPRTAAARSAALRSIDTDAVLRDFRLAAGESAFNPAGFDAHAAFLRTLLTNPSPPSVSALRAYPRVAESFLPRDPSAGEHEALCTVLFAHEPETGAARRQAVETIRALLAGIPGATLTGMPVLGHDAELMLRHDLPRILGVGLVIVVALLLLHYRSLRATALVLVPLAVCTLAVLAWLKLTRGSFNMVNQMALPILFGVGVDYGIFLVSAARQARAEGADSATLRNRIGASSHAIFMAAGTTVLGMGTLGTTSVPAVQSLGSTLSVGMIAAWLCSQFLLVPMVIATARRDGPPGPAPSTVQPGDLDA